MKPYILETLKGKSLRQIKKAICGEYISSGIHRDVYVMKTNPRYVVKIENPEPTCAHWTPGTFANVTEWRNYLNHKDWPPFASAVAPCVAINETGTVLIQRRIRKHAKKHYPPLVLSLFTDIKYDNFGWIGKRFVCCDYPFIPLSLPHKKFKKAKWR